PAALPPFRSPRPAVDSGGNPGSYRAGGAPDALLDADHHPRPYPDIYSAAPRRPHLRADGLYGDFGFDRLPSFLPDACSSALLLLSEEGTAGKGEPARPDLRPPVPSGAGRRAEPPRACDRRRRGRHGRQPGARAAAGNRILARAERGYHLDQPHV